MTDRLNVYRYDASAPLRLVDTFKFPGNGRFFQIQVASNGNVVAACGESGVLVLSPTGRVLAQLSPGPLQVTSWKPGTSYSLNALARPRSTHQFYPSRYYFKATVGGTSGVAEPSWAPTGTISDSGASWTAVGLIDSIVTGLVLDETAKKIYAVGVVGGSLGTGGRVWVFSAAGLI